MSGVKHYLIIVPGLGDNIRSMTLGTSHYKRYGLTPIVFSIGWRNTSKSFLQRLDELTFLIDNYVREGHTISLLGASAGCSAVINAFIRRKDVISKVICVCGRLKKGPNSGLRSFEKATSTSLLFAQSLQLLEDNEDSLASTYRSKVLTIRALFGDQLVPASTATLKGATNITVPVGEHLLSIALALTVFSNPIVKFLRS